MFTPFFRVFVLIALLVNDGKSLGALRDWKEVEKPFQGSENYRDIQHAVIHGDTVVGVNDPTTSTTAQRGILTGTSGTWRFQTMPNLSGKRSTLAFGNGTYVALANSPYGLVLRSTDGLTWTSKMFTNIAQFANIVFANDSFVAWTTRQETYASADGEEWQKIADRPRYSTVVGTLGTQVRFLNDRFFALENYYETSPFIPWPQLKASAIHTSTNGFDWTRCLLQFVSGFGAYQFDPLEDIAYQNGTYIAVAGRALFRSKTDAFWEKPAESPRISGTESP